jgi:hypothetical protein
MSIWNFHKNGKKLQKKLKNNVTKIVKVRELKMKSFLFFVFIVTIILFVDNEFGLCLGEKVAEFNEKEQNALFDRYKIPESLRRYEDVALHLYWMSWYVEVTSKDNWQEATRHPVLYKEGRDLSNVQMSYYFGTTKKNDRQTDFCLRQFVYD